MQVNHGKIGRANNGNRQRAFAPNKCVIMAIMVLLHTIICLGEESFCYFAIVRNETNTVYHVPLRRGPTNLQGVAYSLDRVVSFTSTNIAVHISVGDEVSFKDVFAVVQACSKRHLDRVVLYWYDKRSEGSDYFYQRVLVPSMSDDPHLQPILDEKELQRGRGTAKES